MSIVVATYNRPAMLDVMLNSIVTSGAEVPNKVRIIVVDDASETGEAEAVCQKWAATYVSLPENRGVAGALHAGFQEVDTEFYALWGDDDAFLPNWFPLHLSKIEEGFDVVAGSYWMADRDLKPTRQVTLPIASLYDLRRGNVTCNDGALVRRSSVDPGWFKPQRERAMMMTFWLAMASAGRKFAVIEEPTWLYRRHAGQLSERRPTSHDMRLRRQAMAEYA